MSRPPVVDFSSQVDPEAPLQSRDFDEDETPDIIKKCAAATAKPQRATRNPCDVGQLVLEDEASGVFVMAKSQMRARRGDQEKVPPHLRQDLEQYDVVLERAVDYVGRTIDKTSREMERPKKTLQLATTTVYTGRCTHGTHPLIELASQGDIGAPAQPMRPVLEAPRSGRPREQRLSWNALVAEKLEMVARPSEQVSQEKKDPGAFFLPFWFVPTSAQAWAVSASSCGIPLAPPAVNDLNGLVRTYPRDKYEFKCKLPARYQYEGEKSGSINLKRERTSAKSSSTKSFGNTQYATQSRHTVDAAGKESQSQAITKGNATGLETETFSSGADKTSMKRVKQSSESLLLGAVSKTHATTRESSYEGAKPIKETDTTELKTAITFKKNGQELEVVKFVNTLLDYKEKFRAAIDEIQNMVPALGWKAKVDVKLLEGSVGVAWEIQNAEDAKGPLKYVYRSDRYVGVRKFWAVDLNVLLFGITGTITVGIEVKVNPLFWKIAEFTLKAEGKLGAEINLNWQHTSDAAQVAWPTRSIRAPWSVGGACRVNTVGIYLVDGEVTVEGGFVLNAQVEVDDHKPFAIQVQVDREETTRTWHGVVGSEPPDPVKVVLWDKKDKFWVGNLIGGDA
ncbi:hypothetical protein LZ009_08935 [Ramlibacter sp. XY19]|uniref:hypothetical protein n=1 Tax=Ramlibacter paludis TaxID=2908000 RepID=UPI0023DA1D68|nr:hypothetical protein [Ramlibacter paludis]MCG2592904.1 hypothetical protein [Ramlibacter paludis]